jgi:hypothetical protein
MGQPTIKPLTAAATWCPELQLPSVHVRAVLRVITKAGGLKATAKRTINGVGRTILPIAYSIYPRNPDSAVASQHSTELFGGSLETYCLSLRIKMRTGMPIKLDDTKFALDDHAPLGKLWGRLLIEVVDTDTDTRRTLQLEVLLDNGERINFLQYERLARQEAKKLLSQVAEQL